MKCGDRPGYLNRKGQPCGQVIGVKGCLHHDRPEEAYKAQQRGALASRMRRALPPSTPEPPFDSVDSIIAWAQRMARSALVDEVDPRRLAEARGFAQLALSALNARTQQQLVDALLRIEHGGAAVMLLSRLTEGLHGGARRPLPGRVLSLSSTPAGDAL